MVTYKTTFVGIQRSTEVGRVSSMWNSFLRLHNVSLRPCAGSRTWFLCTTDFVTRRYVYFIY